MTKHLIVRNHSGEDKLIVPLYDDAVFTTTIELLATYGYHYAENNGNVIYTVSDDESMKLISLLAEANVVSVSLG